MTPSQTTDTLLMIRPASFGPNPETAATNAYQAELGGRSPESVARDAVVEFDGLVDALRAAGVEVIIVDDTAEPPTPDAVFPNNWVSFHADGTVVLYPMASPRRRDEVRPMIVDDLRGRKSTRVLDLTPHTRDGRFLEGTGSLVLDRLARVAYSCRSSRTDPAVLAAFCEQLGYEAAVFDATDESGRPVYHTNVVMSVGTRFCVACLDALDDAGQRHDLEARLVASGREIISIARAQMGRFCGNVLEVRTRSGEAVLAMSETAYHAFTPDQRELLCRHAHLVFAPIPTIERFGGGSARCMLAEVHLPRA